MTAIWQETGVTERAGQAIELIVALFILAILAFVVCCLLSFSSPSSEARFETLDGVESGFYLELSSASTLLNNRGRSPAGRPAPIFTENNGPKRQITEIAQVPHRQPEQAKVGKQQSRPTFFTVTAYCPCEKCCGKWSKIYPRKTASGHIIQPDDCFVAAPPWIPFGTRLSIPGYAEGCMVAVLDRGGAIQGNRLDVFFGGKNGHDKALAWGVREMRFEQ